MLHICAHAEAQRIVLAALSESFESGDDRRHVQGAPAVFLRHRPPEDAELRAFPPFLVAEDSIAVAPGDTFVQFGKRELRRRELEGRLLLGQGKIHAAIFRGTLRLRNPQLRRNGGDFEGLNQEAERPE